MYQLEPYLIIAVVIILIIALCTSTPMMTAATVALLVNTFNLANLMRMTRENRNILPDEYYRTIATSGFKSTANEFSRLTTRDFVHKSHLENNAPAPEQPTTKYKGDITYDEKDVNKYSIDDINGAFYDDEDGNAMVMKRSLQRKGTNAERQMAGAYNARNTFVDTFREEFNNVEHIPWYGQYDE